MAYSQCINIFTSIKKAENENADKQELAQEKPEDSTEKNGFRRC